MPWQHQIKLANFTSSNCFFFFSLFLQPSCCGDTVRFFYLFFILYVAYMATLYDGNTVGRGGNSQNVFWVLLRYWATALASRYPVAIVWFHGYLRLTVFLSFLHKFFTDSNRSSF
uniref:Uncharacterized protein n=1 Tax=Anguilla anguilla TaxID=7936 RepID=A0A0E9WD73_ANGAN